VQRADRIRRHQGFTAQHAMLIGERESYRFKLATLDLARNLFDPPRLLRGPQTVTLDERTG
jgi:hypothetical protein